MFSWDAFLDRYRPMAHALALSLSGDRAGAEDLVQEATLALHAALQRDPGRFESTAHARNYLLRSVRNLAGKAHRSAGRIERLREDPPAPGDAPAAGRRAALARLLGELPADEREWIARRFERRETLAAISAATGTPVSTLHSRERALLARLRRRLEAALGTRAEEGTG